MSTLLKCPWRHVTDCIPLDETNGDGKRLTTSPDPGLIKEPHARSGIEELTRP